MVLQLQLVLLLPALRQEAIKRCSRPNAPIRIGSASSRAFGGRPRCTAEGAQGVQWKDPKRAATTEGLQSCV